MQGFDAFSSTFFFLEGREEIVVNSKSLWGCQTNPPSLPMCDGERIECVNSFSQLLTSVKNNLTNVESCQKILLNCIKS